MSLNFLGETGGKIIAKKIDKLEAIAHGNAEELPLLKDRVSAVEEKNNAQDKKIEQAQNTAERAQSSADTAQQGATAAQKAADTAQQTADSAQQAVGELRTESKKRPRVYYQVAGTVKRVSYHAVVPDPLIEIEPTDDTQPIERGLISHTKEAAIADPLSDDHAIRMSSIQHIDEEGGYLYSINIEDVVPEIPEGGRPAEDGVVIFTYENKICVGTIFVSYPNGTMDCILQTDKLGFIPTAAQTNALNSGVTSSIVSKVNGLPAADSIATLDTEQTFTAKKVFGTSLIINASDDETADVVVNADNTSYGEGLRINKSPSGVSALFLGGKRGTKSGSDVYVLNSASDNSYFYIGFGSGANSESTRVRMTKTGELYEKGERVYSANNEPPYPVTSVNRKTGEVEITVDDIGLTEEQTAALNSGATAEKIAKLDRTPNADDIATLSTKQTFTSYKIFEQPAHNSYILQIGGFYIGEIGRRLIIDANGFHRYDLSTSIDPNGKLYTQNNQVYSAINPPPIVTDEQIDSLFEGRL